MSQIEDVAGGRHRALYAAYKAAVVMQLPHGEQILDKFRMPALFETHVPRFPEKEPCARVIDDYARGSAVVAECVEFYWNLIAGCERALPA